VEQYVREGWSAALLGAKRSNPRQIYRDTVSTWKESWAAAGAAAASDKTTRTVMIRERVINGNPYIS
jgi:hypothetical protein